jgi:hypothetical protein
MGCSPKNEPETFNMEASLPQNFGFDKMDLRAITLSSGTETRTISSKKIYKQSNIKK